jgi:hypothetical protein
MKQVIQSLRRNLHSYALNALLTVVSAWIFFALSFQLFFVYLEFSGKQEMARDVTNWISWRIDGTFKNDPVNIWYDAEDHIFVESVENRVKIGKLAGNRNLAFGVKNILEEFLQEKGYGLSEDAKYRLKVEIVYLDVLSTKTNISVFHKNEDEVVVRLKANLFKEGKKGKDIVVEAGSSEVSMSTLIVDEGGKFNQQSLSNAIKKACESLVKQIEKQQQ